MSRSLPFGYAIARDIAKRSEPRRTGNALALNVRQNMAAPSIVARFVAWLAA